MSKIIEALADLIDSIDRKSLPMLMILMTLIISAAQQSIQNVTKPLRSSISIIRSDESTVSDIKAFGLDRGCKKPHSEI